MRVVQQCTAEHFRREVVKAREPALLRGLPVGPCIDLWTPEHLMRKGGRKDVSVHVSPHDRMDFISKNFKYHTLPFDELVRRAAYGCAAPTDDALRADHDDVGGLPALCCSKSNPESPALTPNPKPALKARQYVSQAKAPSQQMHLLPPATPPRHIPILILPAAANRSGA